MFKCKMCGTCCRNLLVNFGQWKVGLFLFPKEVELFSPETISPMWAVGIKGRSRPRLNVKIYQLNVNDCPYISKENRCRLYLRRPMICRAHPLTIHVDPFTNHVIAASVDRKCKACDEVPRDSYGKLPTLFPKDILHANAVLTAQFSNVFTLHFSEGVWLFDLKQKIWKAVTAENVSQLASPT